LEKFFNERYLYFYLLARAIAKFTGFVAPSFLNPPFQPFETSPLP
jgi:hypothetical protein